MKTMGLNLIWSTVVWIFVIGGFTLFFRKRISKITSFIPLPRWIMYLLIGMVFATIEENINCPPSELGGCSFFPFTLVFFFMFLLLHLLLLKFTRIKNFYLAIFIFGGIGWCTEFLLGSSKQVLWSSPGITLLMTFWVILTYAIIVIIPATLWTQS